DKFITFTVALMGDLSKNFCGFVLSTSK
ncbi:uncharacterized protein METZ01_LOCUS403218, partial [marine metagenome]